MICRKCKREVPAGPYCILCGASQTPPAKGPRHRGNGAGSVYKRAGVDGYIAAVTSGHYITKDGKYRQIRKTKCGFKTKLEAQRYLMDLEAQSQSQQAPTFQRMLDTYWSGKYKTLSKSKRTAYDIAAERWKSIMSRNVATITLGELQAVVNKEASTYYPARDMQSLLSHLYQIAMAEQSATVNLARLLTLPPKTEDIPDPFTPEELGVIWDGYAKGEYICGYILLMIYTGMMPGELMGLKLDMIDYDAREIRGAGLKTKKRKETPIVFPDFLIPVLQDLEALPCRQYPDKLVAVHRDKFYELYHQTLKRIGVRDLAPYSCRHTTATALALGNIAPSVIQEVMRHSRLATTQRYIHTTNKQAHAAIATLAPKSPVTTSKSL